MSRLTAAQKKEISLAVLSRKEKPLREKWNADLQDLTAICYKHMIKPYSRWIKSAPDTSFLHTTDCLYLDFGEAASERIYVSLATPVVVPQFNYTYHLEVQDEELKYKVRLLYLRQQEISKYVDELQKELNSVFASCSTIKQLVKVLPEITEYISLDQYELYLPVVQTDKLKKLLAEK